MSAPAVVRVLGGSAAAPAARAVLGAALALASLLGLFAAAPAWEALLRALFPNEAKVLYPPVSLLSLALRHLELVGASSALTLALGLPLGVYVTRPSGREFLPLVSGAVALGQTFPPVAVLALAYPALGFGFYPTLVALTLYGLLPVVGGAVAGLQAVDAAAVDAARGLGMTPARVLARVELPLALRPLVGGVRTSVVVNVGTAAIGAAIGAGGLGLPIFAGLENQNLAYVLEGALPSALLALWADRSLATLERALARGA